MSRLRIYDETRAEPPLSVHTDHDDIARELGAVGVRFEAWEASKPVVPGASQDEVIAAYRADIDRLMQEKGYQAVDVISLTPDNPDRATFRQKFLNEHTHSEDEVRFFVAGSGMFTLHVAGKVYEIECVKDDLIAVPDGTTHWFDMGPEPSVVAIRFFAEPDGWVGHFTGTDIAQRFPRYEKGQAH